MDIMNRLNLPSLNENQIAEINYGKSFYQELDDNKDRRVDVIARKKELLSNIFDLFAGYFNLSFDLKVRFTKNDDNHFVTDSDYIYIDSSSR